MRTEYTPEIEKLRWLWTRLTPARREKRLREAKDRKTVIESVKNRREGETEAEALARLHPDVHLPTLKRWQKRHREHGFDGLLDLREGKKSSMPKAVKEAIITLRRANPDMDVDLIVTHVLEHHDFKTSETTVKRVLKKAGLARRRGPSRERATGTGERRLELGGMKLIEAACVETGYLEKLSQGIKTHVEQLPRPEIAKEPDRSGRDEYGRFLPEYNERYRKEADAVIGPGFVSVEQKREELDPRFLQVGGVRLEVIERKLLALMGSFFVCDIRGDALRAAPGKLLDEVCGMAYMPETLQRFARELKYAGVANTLWEIHARLWLSQSQRWQGEGSPSQATLFIDGCNKAVWTKKFCQAAKVSQVGRTMPALDMVAFHTDQGVPLWILTYSGRAALVKVVPQALAELGRICGGEEVGRIVVIDAESDSIPFLKGLEQGEPSRGWVNRLRDDWAASKYIFNRSNYRAYREGDRIRAGLADFNDPDGGTFRMRVVEIERRSTGKIVYLGASMKLEEREWKAADLADLYFSRWPAQEANFRAVNQAAGLKEVHGYGKRLVDNVSVLTELDKLNVKIQRTEERLTRQQDEEQATEERLREEQRALSRCERRQETVERQIQKSLSTENISATKLRQQTKEQHVLTAERAQRTKAIARHERQREKALERYEGTQTKLSGYQEKKKKLEGARKIFAQDVELDSLLSLLKVELSLLVTYVLREYLKEPKMEVETFLERIVTLPARLRATPYLEILTFEYNNRDPEMMALLEAHAAAINERALRTRAGRRLRIAIDPAPKPRRPPPAARSTSLDS